MRQASALLVTAILAICTVPARAQAQDVLHVVDDKVGIGTDAPQAPLHVANTTADQTFVVTADGDVGIGTTNPESRIHVLSSGDNAVCRLEANGGREWLVGLTNAQDQLNILDLTDPGVVELSINHDGDVTAAGRLYASGLSIGTTVPPATASLHVVRSGPAEILIEQAGTASSDATLRLVNHSTAGANGNAWVFNHRGNGNVLWNHTGTAGNEFQLNKTGDLFIMGSLTVGPGGCSGCDIVFTPDYPLETIAEHAELMWKQSHLPGIGPTPEDAPMNLSAKTGGLINELEKAHIYIEQLHRRLSERDAEIAEVQERLARLERAVLSP